MERKKTNKLATTIVTIALALILSISPVNHKLMMVIFLCLTIAWFGTDLLFIFLHKRTNEAVCRIQ